MNKQNICPRCFTSGFNENCGTCGYRQEQVLNQNVLRPFKVLQNRYIIGVPIGIGGFGITYAAQNAESGERIAVKEYFPQGIALRNADGTVQVVDGYRQAFRHGLERFSMEASVLQTFANVSGIVRVDDSFSCNGTGYIVMEYLTGRTLKKDAEIMGGVYPFPRAAEVLRQTAGALAQVHEAGLLHRDISPDNIMVDEGGNAKLIDFGAARAYMQQQELTVMMKQGYAPIEQYSSTASQGCYTDIYALGCTLYVTLSGLKVPEAPSRLDGAVTPPLIQLRPDIPNNFAAAIDKAIEVLPQNRFQTMREFMHAAEGTGHVYSQGSRCAQSGSGVLRVLNGKCAGMTVSLESGREYLVGRSAVDNHIQIPLEILSKAHFGLSYQDTKGRFIVWDNHSTNGSFFQNGERMIPGCRYAAFPGDIFYLADKECAIQIDVR